MEVKKENYRHGDVIIIPTKDDVKGEEVPADNDKIVLAYGEVTGHGHRLPANVGALLKYNDETYLRITEERAALTHEEHGEMILPKNNYEIKIRRQYVPGGWAIVKD